MSKSVRASVRNLAVSFCLAALSLAVVVVFDIAGIGQTVLFAPAGWLAALLHFTLSGALFAALHGAWVVMAPMPAPVPVPVRRDPRKG